MSTTKSKEELTRLAWLTALRHQGDRQCRAVPTARGGKVCAFALLAELMGMPTSEWSRVYHHVGLNPFRALDVAAMNDGGQSFGSNQTFRKHTFSEIADVVESWFSKA